MIKLEVEKLEETRIEIRVLKTEQSKEIVIVIKVSKKEVLERG